MSKNLTRKGLALGTLIGLGSSLLAGAPAFAANEVVLAPNYTNTTSLTTLVDQKFQLAASLAPGAPIANIAQLKYSITKPAATTVVTLKAEAGATALAAASATDSNNTAATQVFTPGSTSQTLVNILELSVKSVGGTNTTAATATQAIAVTAFIDSNSNGAVDTGEWATTQTVTFKKISEVTSTTTITQTTESDTTATAQYVLDGINPYTLTATDFGINFTDAAGSAIAGLSSATPTVALTASTGVFKATTGSFTALATGATVKVQPLYKKGGSFATTDTIGTAATNVANARTIASFSVKASGTSGAKTVTAGTSATNGAFTVRTNGTYDVVATVKDNASTPAVVGNVAITATITTSATLSGTAGSVVSLTANGTTYTDNTKLPGYNSGAVAALALTSAADGTVKVSISSAGLVDGNTVTVTFSAQNLTSTNVATNRDSVYSVFETADALVSASTSILAKDTYSKTWQVVDQWGEAPADNKYRIYVRSGTLTTVTGTSFSYYPLVVGGKATQAIVDNSVGTGSYTVVADLQVASTSGGNTTYANLSSPVQLTTTTYVVSNNTVGAITLNSTVYGSAQNATRTELYLSGEKFANYDSRTSTATEPTQTANYEVTLSGTAKDSTLAATALKGQSVTISGTGLFFYATGNSNKIYATDSLTVNASSTGTFSFNVWSHTAGKQTVTIKAGAVTKTVDLTFKQVAANATKITWGTLPAQAQAGRALDLAATVTDDWGNVVAGANVNFTSTGVGYVQNTANVTTDANGKATGRLIVLQNDLGTSYLSATLDLATDVVVAKSVEFGLVDADVVAGGHRVFVDYEFAKGRTMTVTIDGVRKYSKLIDSDNAGELAFTQKKAGLHTVTVRISGGLVFTEKVKTN